MVSAVAIVRSWWCFVISFGLILLPALPAMSAEASEAGSIQLVAAVHVHSRASTGDLTLDELAARAEQLGIGALLLTENLALEYEYGLRPLESVIKAKASFPSLMKFGIEQYLHEVEETQARHPNVLLVPGVEVAPHYYWSGSPWDRTLTMHNAQRNLLVFGLPTAEAYRRLPALGNYGSYRIAGGWAGGLLPALLLLSAVWVGVPRLHGGLGADRPTSLGKGKVVAILCLISAAVIIGLSNWPFGTPLFSPYEERLGFQPHQALIESVAAQGGLAFWSLPEARDFRQPSLGPLGTVTIKTDPHPEALLLTVGHQGFGGLYQEARTIHAPGGIWDQLVTLYQSGQRRLRPTMIGEIAFHSSDHAKKELDQVLTVLSVKERSLAGVLAALREGRAYAVERYHKEFRLSLDEFHVDLGEGRKAEGPGRTIARQGAEPIAFHARLSTTDQRPHRVAVRVIRSGEVLAKREGDTPLDIDVTDVSLAASARAAYRLEVTGGGTGELLSNPIYVHPSEIRS